MNDRLTLCNMAIEAGAKTGIIAADEVTKKWFEGYDTQWEPVAPDSDAHYEREIVVNADDLEPQVAAPFKPTNVENVSNYSDVKVDQVFLGSCTNGFLEDLRRAASLLKGRKIASSVRMIVTPATQDIYLAAGDEGILRTFVEAGAAITPPTCGACIGGHMGVLAPDEVALATTNRNFRGRMGDNSSKVYLANPAVAAATALLGHIAHPEEVL